MRHLSIQVHTLQPEARTLRLAGENRGYAARVSLQKETGKSS